MSKLRSVRRGAGGGAGDDLRSAVHFSESGQIWLHEHRMLLVHAEAQASLRRELIDTLGMTRAQGLFTRMGYASGVRDAELGRQRAQELTDLDAFMTGPQLHTLEGMVQVSRVKLELDRLAGRFHGEFVWESSWEGQWHRHYYGIHEEPVCWTQIGYVSGYASAFMGRPILFQETECSGSGDALIAWHVMREACRQQARWRAGLLAPRWVGVPVAREWLLDGQFVDTWAIVLATSGLAAADVELIFKETN